MTRKKKRTPKAKMTKEDFYFQNLVFTTSKAIAVGLGKGDLSRDGNVVKLGTFPVRQNTHKGTSQMETIWAHDPLLSKLVKRSGRAKGDELLAIRDKIEEIMRVKLGFMGVNNDATGDTNSTSSGLSINAATEGNQTIGEENE